MAYPLWTVAASRNDSEPFGTSRAEGVHLAYILYTLLLSRTVHIIDVITARLLGRLDRRVYTDPPYVYPLYKSSTYAYIP